MAKDPVKSLSNAIAATSRNSSFCCGGTAPIPESGIEVDQVGALTFPLKGKMQKDLLKQCRLAPYGKGTETLVNKQVRNTYELSPDQFRVNEEWDAMVGKIVVQVATDLGLPHEDLQYELYKLLAYNAGGKFLPHRDSEKSNGMVASLIIVLPNAFEGGSLIVRHGSSNEEIFPFKEAAKEQSISYAAFYADCEHEVRNVSAGLRVCLAYNLVLCPTKKRRGKNTAKSGGATNPLLRTAKRWFKNDPTSPLVFALEHHYTERGLSSSLLKGTDRSLAQQVVSVAEELDCYVNLAHVSRHLHQAAYGGYDDDYGENEWDDDESDDDGSDDYGDRDRYSSDFSDIEIGETYDDDLSASQWTSMAGKKQPWGELPIDVSSIVSAIPLNEWKPTTVEYEGYIGNEGNTLDRWYHRTAIVIWPKCEHYNVLASGNDDESISVFLSLVSKLAGADKRHQESIRADAITFARAIIEQWDNPRSARWSDMTKEGPNSPRSQFLKQVTSLNDPETIVFLLTQINSWDGEISLKRLIKHSCKEFGITVIAEGLRAVIAGPESGFRHERIPIRDLEWLVAVSELKFKDSDSRNVAIEVCRLAVKRFCGPDPTSRFQHRNESPEKTDSEKGLPYLLKALLSLGCDSEFERVIRFVGENPSQFRTQHGQVPALIQLVEWSRKQSGSIPKALSNWLSAVRTQLESAIANEPKSPADWRRPAVTTCKCIDCRRLNEFLIDPTAKSGRIAATEIKRLHMIRTISDNECDVTHHLERKGSPYSLVLTKTVASYERAVQQYRIDQKLLASLPEGD